MKLSFLNDTIKTHSNQAEKENGGKDMINGFRYFVKNNMEIILDTSTAMHYEGFSKFVEENERDIEASGKKIQVLSAVWFELIRNYNSVDKEKAEAANQAITILSSHRNIFKIDEGKEIFQDEIEDAFADKEILSKLTLDKTEVSILLITNDRMLSKDALEINHQASCKGYKISTCYVSDKGEMLSGFGSQRENKLQKEPEVIVKEVVKIIEVPKKESNLKVSQILVPVTTFMAGAAIGKYGNILFKYFKTAA